MELKLRKSPPKTKEEKAKISKAEAKKKKKEKELPELKTKGDLYR